MDLKAHIRISCLRSMAPMLLFLAGFVSCLFCLPVGLCSGPSSALRLRSINNKAITCPKLMEHVACQWIDLAKAKRRLAEKSGEMLLFAPFRVISDLLTRLSQC